MKTPSLLKLAALLSLTVLSSPIALADPATGDAPQLSELRRAFLGFYMKVGAARAAVDPADVVKAGSDSWHLPDEKSRQSLGDFSAWLLAAKPTDIAVENVRTAGDLARMTVLFAHVEEPHPSRAEVTMVRPGGEWKIVNCNFLENVAAKSDATLPAPSGDSAQETLDNYLKVLSKLAANPETQATPANPQQLAESLAEWWVDNRQRSQARAMTQGAMFFRLYQPKEWAIEAAAGATETDATFSVEVQPGNEVSRRLGPKTLTFGLVRSDAAGWKISRFINPQLVPVK